MEKGGASSKTACMPGGLGKLWEASGKGSGISTPVFRQMTLVGRLWVRKTAWEGGYRDGASNSEKPRGIRSQALDSDPQATALPA